GIQGSGYGQGKPIPIRRLSSHGTEGIVSTQIYFQLPASDVDPEPTSNKRRGSWTHAELEQA
ncbi:unnamed protein product, partial [Heterosigma akashiwo]